MIYSHLDYHISALDILCVCVCVRARARVVCDYLRSRLSSRRSVIISIDMIPFNNLDSISCSTYFVGSPYIHKSVSPLKIVGNGGETLGTDIGSCSSLCAGSPCMIVMVTRSSSRKDISSRFATANQDHRPSTIQQVSSWSALEQLTVNNCISTPMKGGRISGSRKLLNDLSSGPSHNFLLFLHHLGSLH